VFTARYGLSPYIKQTRSVFKGLSLYQIISINTELYIFQSSQRDVEARWLCSASVTEKQELCRRVHCAIYVTVMSRNGGRCLE